MNMFSKQVDKGFTLIELLVVIAIIGLLASTVLAAMGSARESGRDARRISDIKQIQTALELYRNANGGLYPTLPTGSLVRNMTSGTFNISPFLSTIPTDPTFTGANDYGYAPGPNRGSYTLRIQFERNDVTAAQEWCKVTSGTGNATWEPQYTACY